MYSWTEADTTLSLSTDLLELEVESTQPTGAVGTGRAFPAALAALFSALVLWILLVRRFFTSKVSLKNLRFFLLFSSLGVAPATAAAASAASAAAADGTASQCLSAVTVGSTDSTASVAAAAAAATASQCLPAVAVGSTDSAASVVAAAGDTAAREAAVLADTGSSAVMSVSSRTSSATPGASSDRAKMGVSVSGTGSEGEGANVGAAADTDGDKTALSAGSGTVVAETLAGVAADIGEGSTAVGTMTACAGRCCMHTAMFDAGALGDAGPSVGAVAADAAPTVAAVAAAVGAATSAALPTCNDAGVEAPRSCHSTSAGSRASGHSPDAVHLLVWGLSAVAACLSGGAA